MHLWECHQLSYLLMVGETSESIFIGLVYSGHSGRPVQLCEFLLGFFGPPEIFIWHLGASRDEVSDIIIIRITQWSADGFLAQRLKI